MRRARPSESKTAQVSGERRRELAGINSSLTGDMVRKTGPVAVLSLDFVEGGAGALSADSYGLYNNNACAQARAEQRKMRWGCSCVGYLYHGVRLWGDKRSVTGNRPTKMAG